MKAAFEYARKLLHAKDMQEVMQIQADFLQESGFSYPRANETDGVGGFGCERRGPRRQQVIGRDNLNLDLVIAAHEAMGIETLFQKIRAADRGAAIGSVFPWRHLKATTLLVSAPSSVLHSRLNSSATRWAGTLAVPTFMAGPQP